MFTPGSPQEHKEKPDLHSESGPETVTLGFTLPESSKIEPYYEAQQFSSVSYMKENAPFVNPLLCGNLPVRQKTYSGLCCGHMWTSCSRLHMTLHTHARSLPPPSELPLSRGQWVPRAETPFPCEMCFLRGNRTRYWRHPEDRGNLLPMSRRGIPT